MHLRSASCWLARIREWLVLCLKVAALVLLPAMIYDWWVFCFKDDMHNSHNKCSDSATPDCIMNTFLSWHKRAASCLTIVDDRKKRTRAHPKKDNDRSSFEMVPTVRDHLSLKHVLIHMLTAFSSFESTCTQCYFGTYDLLYAVCWGHSRVSNLSQPLVFLHERPPKNGSQYALALPPIILTDLL